MSPKATSKATLHRRYVLRIHDFLVHGSPPLAFCIVTKRIISSRPITRASCKQVAGNDSSGRRTSIRNPTPSHVSFPPPLSLVKIYTASVGTIAGTKTTTTTTHFVGRHSFRETIREPSDTQNFAAHEPPHRLVYSYFRLSICWISRMWIASLTTSFTISRYLLRLP